MLNQLHCSSTLADYACGLLVGQIFREPQEKDFLLDLLQFAYRPNQYFPFDFRIKKFRLRFLLDQMGSDLVNADIGISLAVGVNDGVSRNPVKPASEGISLRLRLFATLPSVLQ